MQLSHSFVGKNLGYSPACKDILVQAGRCVQTDQLPKLHWFNSLLQAGIDALVSLRGAKLYSNVSNELQWIWSQSAFESDVQLFPLLLLHVHIKKL